jgi:hypothetical protein
MQRKYYEADQQQRCAGHDKAHCHFGSSWMKRASARRAFCSARGATDSPTILEKARAVRPPSDGPRSQKLQ